MELNNAYILILKSLAANLPILHSWGYIFPRMLRVVVESGTQVRAKDALANFIDSENRKNWSSDFHFYFTTSSGKDIVTKVKDDLFKRDSKNGVVAVITENPIVDDEEKNYFYVFLDNRLYETNYKITDIVPYPTDLGAIQEKLMKQDNYEMMEEERILRAAVFFLEPYFFRKGELFRVEELIEVVRQMCVVDENARDTNDLPDVFVKYLFEWQEETRFSEIRDLETEAETEADSDETIFYNEKNVFITEKMFKKIVEPMRAYVSINSLKSSLRDNGYLIVGTGNLVNTYTTKVNVSGVGRHEKRIRAMKFERKYLALSGGLDFIDVCFFAGIGGNDDEQKY